MKQPRTTRRAKRTGDIRKDLSESQLAGIGAVALAYNEAESLIDILLAFGLRLWPQLAHQVTSRINGMEGKLELVKLSMRDLGASDETMTALGGTLGGDGFAKLKKYRDAIIHARILDAPAGIAATTGRRAKIEEILLTDEALSGVYDRLTGVRLELMEACNIALKLRSLIAVEDTVNRLPPVPDPNAAADRPRQLIGQDIQASLSRLRVHQTHRLSLPPLPQFPEEPPVPQGLEDYGGPPEPPGEPGPSEQ